MAGTWRFHKTIVQIIFILASQNIRVGIQTHTSLFSQPFRLYETAMWWWSNLWYGLPILKTKFFVRKWKWSDVDWNKNRRLTSCVFAAAFALSLAKNSASLTKVSGHNNQLRSESVRTYSASSKLSTEYNKQRLWKLQHFENKFHKSYKIYALLLRYYCYLLFINLFSILC